MTMAPIRGDGSTRPAGVVVPPDRMPLLRRLRPLKRWRYLGVFGPDVMLCAAQVRVGGLPQGFWAVWDRGARTLAEQTVRRPGRVRIGPATVSAPDLDLVLHHDGDAVDVVSPHGDSYIWTRKQPVRAVGWARAGQDGRRIEVDARGIVDDSAGYHARRTSWRWSTGVGALTDGRAVAWNLIDGLHDAHTGSERTLWVDGVATEVAPVSFVDDLQGVRFREGAALAFSSEAVRERRDDLLVFASSYRQPFGTFAGTLPGGLVLAEGFGVMETHDVRW